MEFAAGGKQHITVANDPAWTLTEWKKFIDSLIKEYGEKTVLYTNAGYNNVSLYVEK